MIEIKHLPELAIHEIKIDCATGNFFIKIIDYVQSDILKNFLVLREYNSLKGEWKFNITNQPKILTLETLRQIFFVYEDENLIFVKDELERVTKYEYAENLLIRVIYPDGSKINYRYDEDKNLIECIGRNGEIIFRNEYDELHRITKFNSHIFFYDDQNWRMIEDEKIFYIYNRKKLITKIIYPNGTEENFDYDERRNLIYKRDCQGAESFFTYNENFLTQEILSDGLIKNYEYDSNGNLIKFFDSKGREIIYKYSAKNLLIQKSVKLNVKDWRQEIFERDIAGRILIHNINGQITNYAYDEKSPFPSLEKTPCGYKFSYIYDKAYRLLTMRTEIGEIFFAHNAMNEIIGDTKIFADVYRPETQIDKSDIEIFDFGGRLVETRNKFGDKFKLTRRKYDLNDNCIERREWRDLQTLQSATGRVDIIKYEYDKQNRLIKKMERDFLTKYKYDCLNKEMGQWQTKTKV